MPAMMAPFTLILRKARRADAANREYLGPAMKS
jgi:hypothetical protein